MTNFEVNSKDEYIRVLKEDNHNLTIKMIRLREALRPFMIVALEIPADYKDSQQLRLPNTADYPTVGDYRKARSVLEE